MKQVTFIESYYNTRPAKASNLPQAIPTKSTTREWRSYYHRFSSHLRNYSHYLTEEDEEFLNNIPNFAQIKGMLYVHKKFKEFFDKLEINGPTSHLVLLSYFFLDYQLFKIVLNVDEETTSTLVKKYCINFRDIMKTKLRTYSANSVTATAAFITGVDLKEKIELVINSFLKNVDNTSSYLIDNWKDFWRDYSNSLTRDILEFVQNFQSCHNNTTEESLAENNTGVTKDEFNSFFNFSTTSKRVKSEGLYGSCTIEEEINAF